ARGVNGTTGPTLSLLSEAGGPISVAGDTDLATIIIGSRDQALTGGTIDILANADTIGFGGNLTLSHTVFNFIPGTEDVAADVTGGATSIFAGDGDISVSGDLLAVSSVTGVSEDPNLGTLATS